MLARPKTTPKPKPPEPAAERRTRLRRERDRKHRQRVQAHRIAVWIELGEVELDWLVQDARWITPQDADSADREAIRRAMTLGIAASARAWAARRR